MIKMKKRLPSLMIMYLIVIQCSRGTLLILDVGLSIIITCLYPVRARDSHIITVDQETFISDGRFASLKQEKESLWTLNKICFCNGCWKI